LISTSYPSPAILRSAPPPAEGARRPQFVDGFVVRLRSAEYQYQYQAKVAILYNTNKPGGKSHPSPEICRFVLHSSIAAVVRHSFSDSRSPVATLLPPPFVRTSGTSTARRSAPHGGAHRTITGEATQNSNQERSRRRVVRGRRAGERRRTVACRNGTNRGLAFFSGIRRRVRIPSPADGGRDRRSLPPTPRPRRTRARRMDEESRTEGSVRKRSSRSDRRTSDERN